MYLTTALVLVLGASINGMDAASDAQTYGSYTQAWHQAADVKRPMLVILNPPAQEVAAGNAISVEELRKDAAISELLDNYIVAEIDTGTEHGKKVHELFGSQPLPRVVVIDSNQKLQIYRTSEHLEHDKLKDVLETYQSGKQVSATLNWAQQYTNPGYCPNCRRNQQYTF